MVRVKPRGRPSMDEESEEADGLSDDFPDYDFGDIAAGPGGDSGLNDLQTMHSNSLLQEDHQQQQQQHLEPARPVAGLLREPSLQTWDTQHPELPALRQQEARQQEEEEPQLQPPHESLQLGLLAGTSHHHNTPFAAAAAAEQLHSAATAAAAAGGSGSVSGSGRKRSRKQSCPVSAAADAAAAAAEEAGLLPDAAGGEAERAGKRTRGAAGVTYDERAWDWASEEEPESEQDDPIFRPHGAPAADENESNCHVCGSPDDAALLLCCEACPFVFHTYCLDPPLAGVPPGSWFCPVCEGAGELLDDAGGLDKILAVRSKATTAAAAAARAAGAEAGGADAAGAEQPQQQGDGSSSSSSSNEFFVKWKDRSYMHCSWVSNEVMQRAANVKVVGQANPIATRLRKFWREQSQAAADGNLWEAEERGQLIHGINPAWVQVDKVLAERQVRMGSRKQRARQVQSAAAGAAAGDDDQAAAAAAAGGKVSGLEYLVSWKELPLEQASWEAVEDLADFAPEIAAYHDTLTPITADAAARKQHPNQQQQQQPQPQGKDPPDACPLDDAAAAAGGGAGTTESERGQGSRKWETTPEFVSGGELHPYQLEGLNWLYHKARVKENVILADEMGLGKTIQAAAYLGALWQDCVPLPTLVVVPLSVLPNWERELSVWAPYLRVISLRGSAAARQLLLDHCWFVAPAAKGRASLQDRVKFHVLLTTYEMLSKHLADIRRLKWATLLVDEAHRLKSATSKLVQDLVRVDAQHRVLLTGTPLQNSLEELFYLMNFLEPHKFSNVEEFKAAYASLNDKDKVAELHRQLAPHMLRRLKKDVLKQLPPKMEQMVRVELSDEQRELYKAILSQNYDALVATDKSRTVVRLRNVMMELRKVVNHPSLLGLDLDSPAYTAAVSRRNEAAAAAAEAKAARDPPVASSEALEQMVAASGKLALLDRMMEKLVAGGHRVLIYSQFTRTLDILEDWVAGRRWGYQRIDGDVSGAVRQARVDSFNAPNSSKVVFLLSTRAGGVGINLATADTVVIFDSDWNPHNDMQALARAHRMGQQRGVMVLRLVTRGTIEERMLQRAKSKMVLEHLVVSKAARADKLEQATLDDILRYGAQELFSEDNAAAAQPAQAEGAQDEQPQQEGEGGNGGNSNSKKQQQKQQMRIVWDDAALERLLDRSQLGVVASDAAAAAEDAEDEEDDFSKAFKVANFDMVATTAPAAAADVQQQQQQQPQPQQQPQQPPAILKDPTAAQQQFWAHLLKDHRPPTPPPGDGAAAAGGDVGAAAAAAAGGGQHQATGRRRRRAAADAVRVSYLEELEEWSSGSGSESEGDSEGGKRRRKKRPGLDDDEAWELPDGQMHEDSEEILDDADRDYLHAGDPLLAAAAGAAAAAAALQAGGDGLRQQQQQAALQQLRQQQQQPPSEDVQRLIWSAESHVRTTAQRTQTSLPQHLKDALDGPFGPAVQAAMQLRQDEQEGHQRVQRVQGSGHMLCICGLTARERTLFLNTLMQFGPPFVHHATEDGWAAFERTLVGKTRLELSSYLLVFLEHLSDCARDPRGSTHGSMDFIPHTLFFWRNRDCVTPTAIWERIAVLHLLSIRQAEVRSTPPDVPMCSNATRLYSRLSNKPGGWRPAHDKALVRGIFMAGYDNWGHILRLEELNLRVPVRVELGLPVDYDSKEAMAAFLAPANGHRYREAILRQEFADRAGGYARKERTWIDRRVRAIVAALMHDLAPRAAAAEQKMKLHQQQLLAQQQQQRRQQPAQAGAGAAAAGEQQQQQQQQPGGRSGRHHPPHPSHHQPHGNLSVRMAPKPQPGQKRVHWAAAVQAAYDALKQKLVNIRQEAQHVQPGDYDAVAAAGHKFRSSVLELQVQAKQMQTLLATLHDKVVEKKHQVAAAPGSISGSIPAAAAAAPGGSVSGVALAGGHVAITAGHVAAGAGGSGGHLMAAPQLPVVQQQQQQHPQQQQQQPYLHLQQQQQPSVGGVRAAPPALVSNVSEHAGGVPTGPLLAPPAPQIDVIELIGDE